MKTTKLAKLQSLTFACHLLYSTAAAAGGGGDELLLLLLMKTIMLLAGWLVGWLLMLQKLLLLNVVAAAADVAPLSNHTVRNSSSSSLPSSSRTFDAGASQCCNSGTCILNVNSLLKFYAPHFKSKHKATAEQVTWNLFVVAVIAATHFVCRSDSRHLKEINCSQSGWSFRWYSCSDVFEFGTWCVKVKPLLLLLLLLLFKKLNIRI